MPLDIRDRVLDLRRVQASTLRPHPKNAREHPQDQRKALRAVLQQIGFAGAILAVERDGSLLTCDGHLRTEEMRGREVPVLVLDLSDDEVETLLLTYDPISAMAKTNNERLDALLRTYEQQDTTDLQSELKAGLDKMLASLAKKSGSEWGARVPAADDEVPDRPDVATTEAGDTWVLGEHRVTCGDSTREDDVRQALGNRRPFIMVTDPPYGVNYDPTFRSNNRTGTVANDHTASWRDAYRLFPGTVAYVWHGGLHVVTVAVDLEACDFQLRAMIIWRKPSLVMGRGHYHWQHEGAFYAAKGSAKWCGDRDQSTTWEIANVHPTHGTTDDGQTEHGCQKPVECMARPIRNHGTAEDGVYDPFLGSGTTIIAAEQLGRWCVGLELDQRYVDVIATRWANFTGREPVLESTGETFAQVRDRRALERAHTEEPAAT